MQEIRASGKADPDPTSGYNTLYSADEDRYYVSESLADSAHHASTMGTLMAIAAAGIPIAARRKDAIAGT